MDKSDEDMLWVKDALTKLLQESQAPIISPKPPSSSQIQTPMIPVKAIGNRRGDGLLPLPALAIPIRSMENPTPLRVQDQKVISPNPKLNSPVKKIEIPVYDGQNPNNWIYRAERCFMVNQTPEKGKTWASFGEYGWMFCDMVKNDPRSRRLV